MISYLIAGDLVSAFERKYLLDFTNGIKKRLEAAFLDSESGAAPFDSCCIFHTDDGGRKHAIQISFLSPDDDGERVNHLLQIMTTSRLDADPADMLQLAGAFESVNMFSVLGCHGYYPDERLMYCRYTMLIFEKENIVDSLVRLDLTVDVILSQIEQYSPVLHDIAGGTITFADAVRQGRLTPLREQN